MKILYFGGQKSGKSNLAEKKALEISSEKPYYIATYDNSFEDKQMQERIKKHKSQRQENFITIEQSHNLLEVLKENQTFLIDCMSMWLFNNLQKNEKELLKHLDEISKLNTNIIFVLNDVNCGVIPFDNESRKFVDLTGIIGQKIASFCDEVYEVKFGIENKVK